MSTVQLVHAKIHRAVVTGGDLNYPGSITIGNNLMRAAGILPYELVHINSITTSAHWETYAIPGAPGEIILNGAPTRLFAVGDRVVILAMANIDLYLEDIAQFQHRVVYINKDGTDNSCFEIVTEQISPDWYSSNER